MAPDFSGIVYLAYVGLIALAFVAGAIVVGLPAFLVGLWLHAFGFVPWAAAVGGVIAATVLALALRKPFFGR